MSDANTNTSKTSKISRFIGKCNRCKAVHRVEGTLVVEPRFKQTAAIGSTGKTAELWKGRWVCCVSCSCFDRSRNVNTLIQLERVRAAAVNTHECGARCRNSTGPSCECSCKGQNHGAG